MAAKKTASSCVCARSAHVEGRTAVDPALRRRHHQKKKSPALMGRAGPIAAGKE
jgi:hypothetical protein